MLQQRVYVRDLGARTGQRVVVREAARPASSMATTFTPPPPPPLPADACVVAVPCPAPPPCNPTPCAATQADESCPGGNSGVPSYVDPCPGGVCGIPSPAAVVRSLSNPFCK